MDSQETKPPCRSKVPNSRKAIVFLMWARSTTALFSPLSRNLAREINSYVTSLDFVWVYEDKLENLNPRTLQWDSPVRLTSTVPLVSASWALVDENKVMVCGGSDGQSVLKHAYEICCNGNVRRIKDMTLGRAQCGIVAWKQALYVFGSFFYGFEGGKTCETLSLSMTTTSEWVQIGDMSKPRAQFTPVVWRNGIFLCGGTPSNNTVAVFDGNFVLLLELKDGGSAVSFAQSENLVILTGSFISVLSVGKSGYTVECRRRPCSPVLNRSGVLLVGEVVVTLFKSQLLLHSAVDGHYLN